MMKQLVAILFILLSHPVFAHEDEDTLAQVAVDTLMADTANVYWENLAKRIAPFDIKDPRLVHKGETKYILQDRYVPKGARFSKWLFDRVELGAQSGYNMFVSRGNNRFNDGVPVGGYMKFNINRLNALRLGATVAIHYVEGMGNGMKLGSVDLDYLFNLSSYLYGHKANRFLNVSTVLGVSGMYSAFRGETGRSARALGGLNFDFNITPSSHVFIEPYISVASDQVDLSATTNEHRWDVMYGVRAGIGVRFNSRNDSLRNVNYNGNFFWEFSQGLTFFPSDDIDLAKSMSTNYTASFGKWLDPFVGVRLSGSVTDFNWSMLPSKQNAAASYSSKLRTVMVGGRMEMLLDVLNLFRDYRMRRNPLFSWQLSMGGEFGYMRKDLDITKYNLNTYYVGFVAGTQFLVSPDEATSLFIEPQMHFLNYSLRASTPGYRKWHSDNVYSLNVGVRVSHPVKSGSLANRGEFVPSNFAGAAVGALRGEHYINSWKPDTKFQTNFGLSVGREFAPLVAAKLQVDYQNIRTSSQYPYSIDGGHTRYSSSMFAETSHLLNAKLAYMLNFTNLYQGYSPSRKVNLFMELGPSYIFVLHKHYEFDGKEKPADANPTPIISNKHDTHGVFAFFGGMACTVNVNEKYRLVLEPYGQLLTRSRIFSGASNASRMTIFTGVNLGVNYCF